MPWAWVAAAGAVNSITGGGITKALGFGGDEGSGAQRAADPFSAYRGQLGQQYANYFNVGGQTDPTKMPGYSQWMSGVLNPALEATQGKMAASGMSFSGTEKQAMQDVAQRGYYGFMTDYLNRLAQGSGAVNNPAQAAALGYQVQGQSDAARMQAFGALAQAGKNIYTQWNSGGGVGSTSQSDWTATEGQMGDSGTIYT
jgi:hypothetical protein